MDNKKEIEAKMIAEAREWLGTPWKHNRQDKYRGVDCINFLWAVGITAGLELEPIPEEYARTEKDNEIGQYLDRHFAKTTQANLHQGCILLMRFSGFYSHVALATSKCTIIHASLRHNKVVEHQLDGIYLRIIKGIWEVKEWEE